MEYMLDRTVMVLRLLGASETVTKTAYVRCSHVSPPVLTKENREFARVFGVDWFSVISRGSQFKVESFMFRIAKPESLVFLSPSKDDVCRSYFFHSDSWTYFSFGSGWKTECRRVYAVNHGAQVRFLQQSIARPGFSVLIPVNHDRLQLLLLDLSGPSGRF